MQFEPEARVIRGTWTPEDDSHRVAGMQYATAAADAACLIVEATGFLREVRNWATTDPEGYAEHWQVSRG